MIKLNEKFSATVKYVNKRTAQGGALAMAAVLLITGATVNAPKTIENPMVVSEDIEPARTAGIVAAVSQIEMTVEDTSIARTNDADITMVAATTDQVEDDVDDAYAEWNDVVMADVKDYLYIRSEDNSEAEIVAKLRAGDVATLIDVFDGWYEIESGNAHGFVSADYCVTGIEAYELALDVCDTYATTTTGGLRVRSEASADSKILKTVSVGTKLIVDTDAEAVDGWVAVNAAGTCGYVSAEYVDVDMETGEAITLEEEAEAKRKAEEAAKKAKEAAAAAAAANQAVLDSASELVLLAALIQIEAGGESYEGQVAVGAVVMNRVRSGGYPNSIYGVIYQRGQFSTSRMVSIISKGPKSTCMQAAQQAMNGSDNTGGATHFRRAGSINGLIIGNHVFY